MSDFLIAIYAEVIKKKERKKAQGYQYTKQRITVLQKTEFEIFSRHFIELKRQNDKISKLKQQYLIFILTKIISSGKNMSSTIHFLIGQNELLKE